MGRKLSRKEHRRRVRETRLAWEALTREKERIETELEEAERTFLEAKADAMVAGAYPKKLTRSTMTALEKSRYMQAHGKVVYDALPWSMAETKAAQMRRYLRRQAFFRCVEGLITRRDLQSEEKDS